MSAASLARKLASNRIAVWIACVLGGGAIHLYLWQVSEPPDLFSDFYKAYYPAAEYLLEKGLSATWPLTEAAAGGFVNIPIVAWLFVPFVMLGEEEAGWAFLAFGAATALAAWWLLARMRRPEAMNTAPLLLLLGLANGPMINSLREGNTTHIILLLIVLAFVLWRSGWDFTAGLLLGLCAVIKLPLLLFGAYYVLRGKWRVVVGGVTSIATAVLLSLADYGLQGNIGWYKDSVEPFLGGVIPAFNVQSIDGFLVRLWTGEGRLHDWDPMVPEVLHKVIRNILFLLVYGGAIWLGWRATRAEPPPAINGRLSARDTLEFVLVITIAIITSPISWTHYYLLLLVAWGLYLGGQLSVPDDRTTRWLMWMSLALTSLPVVIPEHSPNLITEVLARTVVSAWFFGGLLMLAALLRALWKLVPSNTLQPNHAGSHVTP
ncbi:MAG TPA: glycosyltransferase family 87 protein [Hyphomicrobiaceae bacterium]|nr:glycosyltransferase family 87 protein [Hyphomicrobiaceae bacterium]